MPSGSPRFVPRNNAFANSTRRPLASRVFDIGETMALGDAPLAWRALVSHVGGLRDDASYTLRFSNALRLNGASNCNGETRAFTMGFRLRAGGVLAPSHASLVGFEEPEIPSRAVTTADLAQIIKELIAPVPSASITVDDTLWQSIRVSDAPADLKSLVYSLLARRMGGGVAHCDDADCATSPHSIVSLT